MNIKGDWVVLGLAGGEWPINSTGEGFSTTPSGADMESLTSDDVDEADDSVPLKSSSLPFTFPIFFVEERSEEKGFWKKGLEEWWE